MRANGVRTLAAWCLKDRNYVRNHRRIGDVPSVAPRPDTSPSRIARSAFAAH